MTRVLVSVPFSHYCEKARWALDRAGLAYVEDRHLPMLHWIATGRAAGTRTVPVLVTEEGVFPDSTDILHYADRHVAAAGRLFPDAGAARADCAALEERFDERLGPAVRRVGYFHAFARRALVLELARRAAVPRWQFALLRAGVPAVRALMRRLLGLDPHTVAAARDEVMRLFDETAARLDGRAFLVGDRFSAADLTFAALAAPMVRPAEYGFPLPADLFPEPMQAIWRELRRHPAGAFVLRLYAEHRRAAEGSTRGVLPG